MKITLECMRTDRIHANLIPSFSLLPTAKDKGEKKLFGFAFTPLMRDDGTTLSDDIHELYVYKVPILLRDFSPTYLHCS